MRKDGYENKIGARRGGRWQLNDKELIQLEQEGVNRLDKILAKASKDIKIIERSKGFWIIPCDECIHFGNCRHEKQCNEDVHTGRALEHFREKK